MDNYRRKTSTLIQEFEATLGRRLLEMSPDIRTRDWAVLRERASLGLTSEEAARLNPEDLISKAYLQELIQLLLAETRNTDKEIHAKRIFDLTQQIGIADIRNVSAHPVRA